MLVYVGVCWRMLAYGRMLAYVGVCWRMCMCMWRMLVYFVNSSSIHSMFLFLVNVCYYFSSLASDVVDARQQFVL